MFTGLIEALGQIKKIQAEGDSAQIEVVEAKLAPELAIGESVAINGVCLTVVKRSKQSFQFQAGSETLSRTNLGELKTGNHVNIERALRAGDRLGGHLVQGHVDGVGTVERIDRSGEWVLMRFHCGMELAEQMVSKGSVAVDGISLTIVDVNADSFSVALIPHTLQATTLGSKEVGATVNLETDVIGKYVQKSVQAFRKSADEPPKRAKPRVPRKRGDGQVDG